MLSAKVQTHRIAVTGGPAPACQPPLIDYTQMRNTQQKLNPSHPIYKGELGL